MRRLTSKEFTRSRIESQVHRQLSEGALSLVSAYLNHIAEAQLNEIVGFLKQNSSKDPISKSEVSLILSLLEKERDES